MSLNQNQASTLTQASRSAIQNVLSRLQAHWANRTWLDKGNQYQTAPIYRINKDSKPGKSFNHSQLANYVAASTIIHCYDGWSYLARALQAELVGDPDAARHLGYYAELRAAMSILAGEGIGVFNFNHVVVDKAGKCHPFGNTGKTLSTHVMVWEALEHWAGLNRGNDLIFMAIKPGGHSLQAWIDSFGGNAGFVASAWLKQWGLDLSLMSQDREARNIASYQPTTFTSAGPRDIEKTLISVTHFWKICDPESNGGFPILDRHLLRLSLELLFKNKTGNSRLQANVKYSNQISKMVDNLNFTEEERQRWRKFLTYEKENYTPQLLVDANRKSPPNNIDHSKQVLARATLLLRVATGSLSDLFHLSNLELDPDLDFWWTSESVRRCLWALNTQPESFIDLWQDVDNALGITQQWVEDTNRPECYYSFWERNPYEAMTLTTSERIFLWGLS